ncbi:MAG TPA: hypothetical protein DEF00_04135 [Candidatus Taylorbacteria bacterium]|nr:MAG: hypothetical protein UY03_C0022G0004 [Parcubacteria group bacterium GW2011_GWA2_47_64]KKU96640.1 MAG: hypothetical protein UY29_C0009G0054 [Parcubacteria group bacterium GW2011_GWC2_48_17]HBV01545.1 hypothetical protein [Candidatus Taylorbacteria bacterium]
MKGFTLLEILLALGIAAVVTVISVTSLSNFNKGKALGIETEKVFSLLTKARSLTLAAKDGLSYGVHFEERKAVLFSGVSYSANASTNQIQLLNDEVKISTIALTGGGAEVLFKKLSGATDQNGTITLALVRDASKTKIITVAGTGIAFSN